MDRLQHCIYNLCSTREEEGNLEKTTLGTLSRRVNVVVVVVVLQVQIQTQVCQSLNFGVRKIYSGGAEQFLEAAGLFLKEFTPFTYARYFSTSSNSKKKERECNALTLCFQREKSTSIIGNIISYQKGP